MQFLRRVDDGILAKDASAGAARSGAALGHVIWLTGLSGSGKSTLAAKLLEKARACGRKAEHIDGDLTRDFFEDRSNYSRENRLANVKRIAFGAHLLARNGILTIVSNIAPYAEARAFSRTKIPCYCEIYLKASVEECSRRDVKGLYARARKGELQHMIGIDEPYEIPHNPDLIVETGAQSPDESFETIVRFLSENGIL